MTEILQKIPENSKPTMNEEKQTSENLDSMLDAIKKGNVPQEKMEHIFNYVLHLAEIEGKYQGQKEEIKKGVRTFIEAALGDRLNKHLGEFNVTKFDVDGQKGWDREEEKNFGKAMQESVGQIIILGGLEKFSTVYHETNSKSSTMEYVADKVNFQRYIFGEGGGKHFTEKLIQQSGNINEEKFKQMQENIFHPTSLESWKELGIIFAREVGDGAEDILKFLGSIPSSLILAPQYLEQRYNINMFDEVTKTKSEIKLNKMVEQNPALGLLELLGEKGIEALKKISEMLVSRKQGDIATTIISMLGVLAGGVGLARWGLKFARKSAIETAKKSGKEARMAGETTSVAERNTLKKREKGVAGAHKKIDRVNDIIGGAGIGHMTGAFSSEIAQEGKLGRGEKEEKEEEKSSPKEPPKNESISLDDSLKKKEDVSLGDASIFDHKTQKSREENIVKKREGENKEVIHHSPEEYSKAYRGGLKTLGKLLADVKEYQVLSSNAMFAKFENYKFLPDDFDVAIMDKDFHVINKKLQDAQTKGEIRGLTVKSLDGSHSKHITDQTVQDELLKTGNLKITFHIDTPEGIPFEVEMFANALGHGHTQPGYIPRKEKHSVKVDDVEIKLASSEATADLYTLNFIEEIFNNDVVKHGNKTKDASRIESLIRHLQETGDKDPGKIIERMHEVEKRYRDYANGNLSPVLEKIFGEIPIVEKRLNEIIGEYNNMQALPGRIEGKLPEFQEFIETWKVNKGKMHELYQELLDVQTLSRKRIGEIRIEIIDYEKKMKRNFNLSLNNEDFAYYYEMTMVKEGYIKRVQDRLNQLNGI